MSSLYETDPVGGPDQDPYLNAVVIVVTDLDPWAMLAVTQSIERHWHRVREVRWGPRTLDIDIIFFDDLILKGPGNLQIPRPELKHAFVLEPLAQIAPDYIHPETGMSLSRTLRIQPPE